MEKKTNQEILDEKVWDISLVMKDIEELPQTYETILFGNTRPTLQTILRRKLNILCSEGEVCKAVIPGTRFGQVLFYTPNKKYTIVMIGERIGTEVFCFYESENLGGFRIKTNEYWKLIDMKQWLRHKKEKIFFKGHMLKML